MTQRARWLLFLLRDNSILWVGMMLLNLATYAAQLLVARMLGQEEFGSFVAVASLVNLLFLPTASIQTIVARQAALVPRPDRGAENGLVWSWLPRMAALSLIGGVAFVVISPWIARFMQFDSVWPVVLVTPAAVAALCLPVPRGGWQGAQRFSGLAGNLGIEGAFRLVLALLIAGLTLSGAEAAASYGLAALAAFLLAMRHFRRPRPSSSAGENSGWDSTMRSILIAGVSLMLILNMDILAVKHFGSAGDTGSYAAATFFGRIAIFTSATVPFVMLPKMLQEGTTSTRALRIFGASVLLVLLVCFVSLAYPLAYPAGFARAFFGPAFVLDRSLLLVYGVAATLYALVNTCVNLYFAVGRTQVQWIMAGTALLEFGLLWNFHDSPSTVALCMASALALALVVLIVDVVLSRGRIFGYAAVANAPTTY
jgi:O-antigen/teichoic acid export membrane protein